DAVRLQREMFAAVDDVGRVAAAEGIDIGWAKGGTIAIARTPLQAERARASVERARSWGFGEQDFRLMSAGEVRELINVPDALGGVYTPHCAAIHPARLVRGLAQAVERRGGEIFERTPCVAISPGEVLTPHGRVSARYVVRATEGFTPGLPGL